MGALNYFETLIDEYPSDVNGEFYSAICLMKLNKHQQAIFFLDKVLVNSIPYFWEDAQWLKANCLEETGQLKLAYASYKKIADENGFYALQAKEKLGR